MAKGTFATLGDGTFTVPRLVVKNFGFDQGGWRVERHPRHLADITGDGRADIVGFGEAAVIVALSNGDGTFAPEKRAIEDFCFSKGWRVEKHVRLLADVRSIGRADIVGFGEDGVIVALSNGDGTFAPPQRMIDDFCFSKGWRVEKHVRLLGDITGDGRADIVGFGEEGVIVALSNGDGSFTPPDRKINDFCFSKGWRVDSHPRFLADISGDGRADIVGFGAKGTVTARSNGDGSFTTPKVEVQDFGFDKGWRVGSHVRLLGDITGDGRADVVGFGADGVAVSRSLSNGKLGPAELAIGDFGASDAAGTWRVDRHPRLVGDITGDGRDDIVGFGGAGVIVALPQTFTTSVLRSDDLLELDFEFVNLRLVERDSGSALVRVDPGLDAIVIVGLPPQHVAEEVFEEAAVPDPPAPPVRAVLAGPTRLAFRMPAGMKELPFELDDLLAWERLTPNLAANAEPPTDAERAAGLVPTPAAPEHIKTAIEAPYRVVLSPGVSGRWAHATNAVSHSGRTELWHTRLASVAAKKGAPPDESATAERTIRAVWSPDAATTPPPPPPPGLPALSLSAAERANFVGLSSDFSKDPHAPIHADRLMLTGLGAWLDWNAVWTTGDEWQQRSTQGRDNYVRVTTRGHLCPFGHQAVFLEITERKLEPGPDGLLTAYLRKREFIVVKEHVRDYRSADLAPLAEHGGRQNPFSVVRVLNDVVPVNSPDPNDFDFPSLNGVEVQWAVVCEDGEGKRVDLSMPLLWVPERADAAQAAAKYNQRQLSVATGGKPVAFAPARPGRTGEAALSTNSVVFEPQVAGPVARFLPQIGSAEVRIPAVDSLLGAAKATAGTTVSFDPGYLQHEFDAVGNKGQLFVRTTAALPVAFPAERAGGLARPDLSVGGLSRALGAVGDVDNLANGTFDPASFFGDAKLLGLLPLKEVIPTLPGPLNPQQLPDLAGLDPDALWAKLGKAETLLKVPAFTSRTLRDKAGIPTAVETQYAWKPDLKRPTGDFAFFDPTGARLVLATTLHAPLDGSPPTFESRGELSGFALDFDDVLKVDFGRFAFVARSGRKLDVSADGVNLTFHGKLRFVNTIQGALPPNGFVDPPAVSVTPDGIKAGYSLGLPPLAVGVFSLENIALSAALTLPFVDSAATVRFALSTRHDPFLVTVSLFGGGGFFALGVRADNGPTEIEASIEFGGNIALDLIVASGGVHVMAGIYFKMAGGTVDLSGYLRAGGSLEVLGLITVTAEFYMALTYHDPGKVKGEASLTVGVEVLFFSKHVTLHVERQFAGASGDPSFDELVEPDDWATYCGAFAA